MSELGESWILSTYKENILYTLMQYSHYSVTETPGFEPGSTSLHIHSTNWLKGLTHWPELVGVPYS